MRSLVLVLLVAIGAWLGIWLGQSLLPVEYTDSNPQTLSASARARYITNIAIAYAADADLPAAQERLDFLEATPLGEVVLGTAEWAIAAGWPLAELRALAGMAADFEMTSAVLLPYLPTAAP